MSGTHYFLVVLAALLVSCGESDPLAQAEKAEKSGEVAAKEIESVDVQSEANRQRLELEAARSRLQAVVEEGAATRRVVEALRAEMKAWRTESATARTSDRGRAVAASEFRPLVESLLQSEKRATDEQLEELVRKLTAALGPIEQQVGEEVPAITDEVENRARAAIASVRSDVRAALAVYKEDRDTLVTALSSVTPVTSGETLEEAIARRKRAILQERAGLVAAAEERVEQEKTAAIVDIKRRAAEERANAEVEETKAAEEKKTREAEAAAAKAKHDALIAKASAPANKRRFPYFLEDGVKRLGRGQNSKYEKDYLKPGPVSYKRLIELGALSKSEEFAQARTKKNPDPGSWQPWHWSGAKNDRPTAPFPKTKAEWATCEADFKLFKELAPIWAKDGTLRP